MSGIVSDPYSHSSSSGFGHALFASSGFTDNRNGSNASFTRPWEASSPGTPPATFAHRGEPPRKRINRGDSPNNDSIDLLNSPGSPQISRPSQRRKVASRVVSSASEDESIPETKNGIAGPSQPRIRRTSTSDGPGTPASDISTVDHERFTKFKMIHPEHAAARIQAAWQQAGGDESKANAFLDNPSWSPPSSRSPLLSRPRLPTETGRVKEVDDAREAERIRLKDLGKKSLIHKNRVLDSSRPPASISTPPRPKAAFDLTKAPPQTPESPEIRVRPPMRLKRKAIASDSEEENDGDESDSSISEAKQAINGRRPEMQALNFFNTAAAEALQEVTGTLIVCVYIILLLTPLWFPGCSLVQAQKIVELRPFGSIDDLNTRLAQGRKKAGPAGISSRLFEDCASIFEGYGKVDGILEECEDIGLELRNEIATWTTEPSAKKAESSSSRNSPFGADVMEDGALTLRTQAILNSKKPKYYIQTQPSLLNKEVQLKEYQMLGINWLNLLYQKKLSCILADEMGV